MPAGFLPYDYGVFAFVADTRELARKKLPLPRSIQDLLATSWHRNVILEDPRTSAPGLAFLTYTRQVKGEGVWEFWKQFRSQWLTLTPGWDGAYSLFLRAEAPLVWSYTTSQAYHAEHGDKEGRYRAIVFDEGNPIQIEGAALVRGWSGDDPEAFVRARSFLEFLISDEVQALVPRKNWMLPVIRKTPLPPGFLNLPQPQKVLKADMQPQESREMLQQWSKIIGGAR
jgi:thiamine transport system substrate-binding protein